MSDELQRVWLILAKFRALGDNPIGLTVGSEALVQCFVPETIIEVALKELPNQDLASADNKDKEGSSSDALNGVAVTDIDNAVRHQAKLPASVKGALVTEVTPDSAAYEAGLRQGDVIQEINRKPVKSAEEAVRLTEKTESKTTLLRVWRNGGSHYVVVDESKAG